MWWATAGVCFGIFQNDGVNRGEVETIVDSFPGQSIDFFGAMRARVYDDKVGHVEARDCALLCSVRRVHSLFPLLVYLRCLAHRICFEQPALRPQVREFVEATGIENLGKRLVNSREGKVEFEPPKMNVETLLKCAFGSLLCCQQPRLRACLGSLHVVRALHRITSHQHAACVCKIPAWLQFRLIAGSIMSPYQTRCTGCRYGNLLVDEQENVKRVQLATEYLDGSASLAGGRQSNDKGLAQAMEKLDKEEKEEKKVRSW